MPDGHTLYLSFEYLNGLNGQELVIERVLGPQEVLGVAHDLVAGLVHLHENQPPVYHCDIKPANFLHTDSGSVLIDFNVAVSAGVDVRDAGATRRYLVPDFAGKSQYCSADYVDRDLFALGVTLYELLTGAYPWESASPPTSSNAINPLDLPEFTDLAPDFVDVLLRMIDSHRERRFSSAREVATALRVLRGARRAIELGPVTEPPAMTTNPFVAHLKTLYSQSTSSNRGTRGLDPANYNLYVETRLDSQLQKDVLLGLHKLVIITGNAGDGKTAFIEHLTAQAIEEGAQVSLKSVNGAEFTHRGRTFRTNMDGSQDEEGVTNDEVLVDFFAAFSGSDPTEWPTNQVRLIAINEGRLVDFFLTHHQEFPALTEIINGAVDAPGDGDAEMHGVVVISLNARSVTAVTDEHGDTVFLRVLRRMTDERFWAACSSCELAARCYARHNAATFAHPTSGHRIATRLQELYRLTHHRGRLHITLRDLRSAIAFMLTSGRDCTEIRDLYTRSDSDAYQVLDSFYFTSWRGVPGTKDRLLGLLADVDMAAVPNPHLDRQLTYRGPARDHSMLNMEGRGDYDQRLLDHLFSALPRNLGRTESSVLAYQGYLASARRRYFFECLDEKRSRGMLPYSAAGTYLALLAEDDPATGLDEVLDAINRGEGWYHKDPSGAGLVLQVRHVVGGTIRSYRSFPAADFSLRRGGPQPSRYLEVEADHLVLRHEGGTVLAELRIWLDLFELLRRRRLGYRAADPDAADLGLRTFRHQLAAAPYQDVLLTVNGVDGHRIHRDGQLLTMSELPRRGD